MRDPVAAVPSQASTSTNNAPHRFSQVINATDTPVGELQHQMSGMSLQGGQLQGRGGPGTAAPSTSKPGLPFDEEAKLVYGVVFSLRNMVRKMAGR